MKCKILFLFLSVVSSNLTGETTYKMACQRFELPLLCTSLDLRNQEATRKEISAHYREAWGKNDENHTKGAEEAALTIHNSPLHQAQFLQDYLFKLHNDGCAGLPFDEKGAIREVESMLSNIKEALQKHLPYKELTTDYALTLLCSNALNAAFSLNTLSLGRIDLSAFLAHAFNKAKTISPSTALLNPAFQLLAKLAEDSL